MDSRKCKSGLHGTGSLTGIGEMLNIPTNSLFEPNQFGYSKYDFTSFKDKQSQLNVSGLVSGLPKINTGIFDSVSPNLLNQIYDAKALTPNIINNYISKVDDVLGGEYKVPANHEKVDYKTIVDEVLEKANGDNTEVEDIPDQATSAPDSDSLPEESTMDHFGIVGEIFDKYA